MTPAGEIAIELTHRAGQVAAVKIGSTRPEAARVLIGKTPEQVLSMVPLLFSVCGNAQAYAALLACRAALHMPAEPEADAARECLLQLETLREHAWRILLDWPGLLNRQADKSAVATLLKIDRQIKSCLFQEGEAFKLESRLQVNTERLNDLLAGLSGLIDLAVFKDGLSRFQALAGEEQLKAWMAQNDSLAAGLLHQLYGRDWLALGRNEVAGLPMLGNQELHSRLQQEDLSTFCRVPQWQSCCHESTPFSRQQPQPVIAELQSRYGNGLLPRYTAVLVEMATILRRPSITVRPEPVEGHVKTDFDKPVLSKAEGLNLNEISKATRFGGSTPACASEGIALAQVQAARGLLIHRLELRQGRVYDYRIVAPTEWNFHPDGVLAQGLKSLQVDDADGLRQQAEWLINAVDPCVQYRLVLSPEN